MGQGARQARSGLCAGERMFSIQPKTGLKKHDVGMSSLTAVKAPTKASLGGSATKQRRSRTRVYLSCCEPARKPVETELRPHRQVRNEQCRPSQYRWLSCATRIAIVSPAPPTESGMWKPIHEESGEGRLLPAVKAGMRYIPDGDTMMSSGRSGTGSGAGSSVPMAGSRVRVQNGPFLDGLPQMGPLPLFGGEILGDERHVVLARLFPLEKCRGRQCLTPRRKLAESQSV